MAAEVAEVAAVAEEATEEEPEQAAAEGNCTLTLAVIVSDQSFVIQSSGCGVIGRLTYHIVVEQPGESLEVVFSVSAQVSAISGEPTLLVGG